MSAYEALQRVAASPFMYVGIVAFVSLMILWFSRAFARCAGHVLNNIHLAWARFVRETFEEGGTQANDMKRGERKRL